MSTVKAYFHWDFNGLLIYTFIKIGPCILFIFYTSQEKQVEIIFLLQSCVTLAVKQKLQNIVKPYPLIFVWMDSREWSQAVLDLRTLLSTENYQASKYKPNQTKLNKNTILKTLLLRHYNTNSLNWYCILLFNDFLALVTYLNLFNQSTQWAP